MQIEVEIVHYLLLSIVLPAFIESCCTVWWPGGRKSFWVCGWSWTGTAACHWTHSSAWWRCCPVWTAVCLGSFFLPLSPESPALCPQLSQLSSPVCPVSQCLSSCCFLPSKPQHKRGRWPPQTVKIYAAVFCRCWRTQAFSKYRRLCPFLCKVSIFAACCRSPCPDESAPCGAERRWHPPRPASPGIQTAVDLVHGGPGVWGHGAAAVQRSS